MVVTGSVILLLERLETRWECFTKNLMVTAFDVVYGKPNSEPFDGLKKEWIKVDSGCCPLGGARKSINVCSIFSFQHSSQYNLERGQSCLDAGLIYYFHPCAGT